MESLNIISSIKAARVAQHRTQADIARLAGIPLRTHQRLEAGDPGARLDTLIRVLDALGLDLKTASKRRPAMDELNEIYGNE